MEDAPRYRVEFKATTGNLTIQIGAAGVDMCSMHLSSVKCFTGRAKDSLLSKSPSGWADHRLMRGMHTIHTGQVDHHPMRPLLVLQRGWWRGQRFASFSSIKANLVGH